MGPGSEDFKENKVTFSWSWFDGDLGEISICEVVIRINPRPTRSSTCTSAVL